MAKEHNMSMTSYGRTDMRLHIGLGVSSFALGAVGTVSFMLLAGYAAVIHNGGSATPTLDTMIGGGLMLVWISNLIGIGLGIAGAVDRPSKKTLPVLGLVLNFGILALSAAIVAIGLRA